MQQALAWIARKAELEMGAEFFSEGRELLPQKGDGYRGGFQLKWEWHDLRAYHPDQR